MDRRKVVLGVGLLASVGLLPGTGAAQPARDREVPPELESRSKRPTSRRPGKPAKGAGNVRIKGNRLVLTNRPASPGEATTTGGYDGVTPGLPRMPRIHLPRAAHKRCYLTWTGFQMLPTGSRIFLQFNRKPAFAMTNVADSLRIQLKGCRVASWNNTRPLVTRFFKTPVKSARVRQFRGSTELRILLKKSVAARTRTVRLQGWHYLFVTFRHTHSGWTAVRAPKHRRRSKGRKGARRGPQAR
ncbi:MAG: hypothetical protein ABI333_12735 [bacterium]